MKFILDDEQKLFGETLDKLLAAASVPGVARDWAAGSRSRGLELWRSLAEAGLFALAVPESSGGVGPLPVELVTAFRVLGKHGVPGPYVETVAVAELLSRLEPAAGGAADSADSADSAAFALPAGLSAIAEGAAVVSLALPWDVPLALDADAAGMVLTVDPVGALRHAAVRQAHDSLDPARRLFSVQPGEEIAQDAAGAAAAAYDLGALLTAAQLSGLGDRLLEITVEYAKTRQQFGKPIGEFQAVKHHLADAYVALEHARPLLYGAALSHGSPDFARDASAAKAAASDAAYFASRIALQVHGAIGYTDEYDPSLLIRKVRALRGAWGSPSAHKARVMDSLTAGSR
jgi:alkylation response protein AidB-like acyl-CoA dehydrogenase